MMMIDGWMKNGYIMMMDGWMDGWMKKWDGGGRVHNDDGWTYG
jgi:hypothetical protein